MKVRGDLEGDMNVDLDLNKTDGILVKEVGGPALKEEENKVATLRNSSIQFCLLLPSDAFIWTGE